MENQKYPTMTNTQMALRYKVCLKTFNKMLAIIPELNFDKSIRAISPKQVSTIFEHLGEPPD